MTPDQLVHQNRTKWRLIARREMRDFMAGKTEILRARNDRQEHDLARTAYEAGYRAARSEPPQ